MRDKKRSYVWLSLLLTGMLCMSGSAAVWANGEEAGQEEELSDGMVSDNELESFQEESHGETQKGGGDEAFFERDETEMQSAFPDSSLSSDILSSEDSGVSENQSINEEVLKKSLNVVLPTDVPFRIMLFGEKGLKGMIDSKQFCIENKGFEDVCVSIEGVCLGENEEDYTIRDVSIEEGVIRGKKNIWIYLQWEDEDGKELDRGRVVMGDASAPGEGEVILKAPLRNSEGEITGENPESKAYFSIGGDLYSDIGEIWKDNELGLELNLSMKAMASAYDFETMAQPETLDEMGIVSDNSEMSDLPETLESISHNADVSDAPEEVGDGNEGGKQFSQVSANDTAGNLVR